MFGMSLETQGNQTLGRDISGFWLGYVPGAPEKFQRKKLVFLFGPYFITSNVGCF